MKTGALLLVLTCSAPATTQAQAPAVAPGDAVRIWSAASGMQGDRGTVETVRADSLDVRAAGASTTTRVSWNTVTRVDVQRGHHSKWRGALIWGGAIGFGAALIAGSATHHSPDREWTVPLGFWTGFGVGAVIGAHRDTTRWVRVRR